MSAQHTHCRECGAKLESYEQPAIVPGRVRTYVTCPQMDVCPLGGYTLDDATYGETDLTPYYQTWERKQAEVGR